MKRGLLAFLAVLSLSSGISASPASAAHSSQVIVTPTNTQGWTDAEPAATTRDGGAVTFVTDPTAPGSPNSGALQLTTPLLPLSAKAQYMHAAAVPLESVNQLSYYTKQVSGPPVADPSYQVQVCLTGATPTTCGGFTTLVYEPYHNGGVSPGIWQWWDVDAGRFWSSRTVPCGPSAGETLVAGGGGAPFYTLATVRLLCPNAVVIAFGVNVGTNNPGYVVRTDLFNFNGTTYNFEPDAVCREKTNNKDKHKEKDNNKDGNKLPKCDKDSGDDDDDSGDSDD